MSAPQIPFNKARLWGNEFAYIQKAIEDIHISGDGEFTRKCQRLIEERVGAPKVLLTTSCTHALEMSALLLNLTAGDEVILPTFTFVSTANAYLLRGARPVFADIRPDTLNLDENQVGKLISPRTRAVVPVHYAGVGCEMDAILELTSRHGIEVVEDNAHGLFGTYRGRALGTFGGAATLSFHETKNFTCGEGGALIINRPEWIERAEIIREKGTNRSRFFRGQIDKYTWVDLGSSYLPSDILAAFLYAQLENAAHVQARRREIWERYYASLQPYVGGHGVVLPHVPPHCEQTYHMFYLLLPSLDHRQSLMTYLKQRGILAVFHYLPLHLSQMGKRLGGKPGDCPVAEALSDRILRLPFYASLTEADQARVVDSVIGWMRQST